MRVLDARDGLPPLLSQAWWRGLLKASDGRLWFATQRGLAVVDPARLPPPVPPPRTRITTIHGPGGREMDWPARQPIVVSYDQRQLDVGHHARVLGTPERVRYESRLLPGGDWRDIGTSRKTLLRDMRSGRYQLEVRATLNGLEWGETAVLPFLVRPPVWETGWFVSCVALAGTGLVVTGVRGVLRMRYKKRILALERVAALDRERARIARDLHDDLGSTMTQIALSLERAVRDAAASGMKVEEFRDGLEATRRGMASLSATVWALHPTGDQLPALCTQVGDQASRFLRRSGVLCDIDIPEDIPAHAVSAESRHHLVLIVREVLNNLVRHAHARRAWVTIRLPVEGLVIEVRDDGRGFDPALVRHGGHGLANLRERASAMGATLQIDARSGQGTRVSLVVPWSKLG
jgi:signal transduction histidine kinase